MGSAPAQWAKAGAAETLVDRTKAKTAGLGRAKGTETAVNSSTRMEAVRSASGNAAVTVSRPMSAGEASPAAAVETVAGDATAVEPNCTSAARPEGPTVRIQRTA